MKEDKNRGILKPVQFYFQFIGPLDSKPVLSVNFRHEQRPIRGLSRNFSALHKVSGSKRWSASITLTNRRGRKKKCGSLTTQSSRRRGEKKITDTAFTSSLVTGNCDSPDISILLFQRDALLCAWRTTSIPRENSRLGPRFLR